MNNPIPCWAADGFQDVEAPTWWMDALEAIWPDGGKVTKPIVAYDGKMGRKLELFSAAPAGTGYVLALYDRDGQTNAWLPTEAALLLFMAVRNDAWLGRDIATGDKYGLLVAPPHASAASSSLISATPNVLRV